MKIGEIAVIGASIALALGNADRALAIAPSELGAGIGQPWPIERTQYAWGGRPNCWYDEGWHGPGWYHCGNPWQRGHSWRDGYGWGDHEPWERGDRHGRGDSEEDD